MYTYIFNVKKLKERRKALEYTTRDLGRLVRCHHSSISNFERGRHPQADVLGRIAGVLRVTPDYFYDQENTNSNIE